MSLCCGSDSCVVKRKASYVAMTASECESGPNLDVFSIAQMTYRAGMQDQTGCIAARDG